MALGKPRPDKKRQQGGELPQGTHVLPPGGWAGALEAPVAAAPVRQPLKVAPKVAPAPAAGKPQAAPPVASHAAAGAALLGALLFIAGAFPRALPRVFLAFAATALPFRFHYYLRVQPWNRMYLLDFCYAASLATLVFLCLPPELCDPRLEAAVYALADGPVSGALVAWQCAYVFHSHDHIMSVLIHLLPGLAMAAHHHLPPHTAAPGLPRAPSGTWDCGVWLLAAPLAFYMAWQAAYYFAVQVLARRYICQHKLDTSYRCLTRRAQRANNVWARIVLRGSTQRRIVFYGLLQLAFTVVTLLLFLPTYHYPLLAAAWQAVKFLVPVYFGFKHQFERGYKAAMAEGVRQYVLQVDTRGASPSQPAAAQ